MATQLPPLSALTDPRATRGPQSVGCLAEIFDEAPGSIDDT